MKEKKILIYGAGATGIFLGAKLHNAGFPVLLCGRKKLHDLGKQVVINGEPHTLPERTWEVRDRHFDVVFVMVKLYNLLDVLSEMKERNVKGDIIVLSQNGMFDEEIFHTISKEQCVDMIIFEGYLLDAKEGTMLAQPNTRGWQLGASPQSENVRALLKEAEIFSLIRPQARAEKMIVNCAINALSVVENKNVGEILQDPQAREKLISIMREAHAVLAPKHSLRDVEAIVRDTIAYLATMKSHYPSLYQDFHAGKRTEIEHLNGKIIAWAKEQGIQVPVNESVYKRFREMELKKKR
jgi:2-dehydropantoate 2-reductase